MKTIIYTTLIFFLSLNFAFSESGWIRQTSFTTSNLFCVYFINSGTGWACGDSGKVLNTTNGGVNWSIQNSTTSLPLYSVMFADANTGWAVGGYDDHNPLCSHNVIVLKTTNGGANWLQQISGIGYLYNDLYVVNNQTAYISNSGVCCPSFCIASAGSVSKTTNSGLNWTGSIYGASNSIYFLDSDKGWALSYRSSDVPPYINYIYRTSNAGSNWEVLRSDTGYYYQYKNIMFVNDSTGYLYNRSLLKSTNGGFDWQKTDSISTAGISNHFFINENTGWCCGGSGKIIRTNNGGANWSSQISNTTNSFSSIHFVDAYIGWIVGSGGIILKTVSGGLTSVNQSSSSIINSLNLNQNYPNPFNPRTIINYELGITNFVKIKVFDALGKEAATLVNEKQNAGSYSVEFNGEGLPSGIYFYKIEAGDFAETKRMVLLK
ncbi:MAG: T9SS type A sorting domain-containing protein [Ignavibacteria bacterium]|nr:T9SS type A sorting domain-containing protein [Ignavibacteria bacterium]